MKTFLDGSMKSIFAALVAGLGAYQTAILDNQVTQAEWVNIVVVTLAALGLVYGVSNSPDKVL